MTKEWKYVDAGSFQIDPIDCEDDYFELDVPYTDSYYGTDCISLDALKVYQKLKDYFKGTEYE